MSGEVFSDSSMLEIFRAEVETHVESLTSGLLALERDPNDTSHIDEMMRGAHSIKGAARIVGIDPAVRVAHVMEDGFIAAQNGKVVLRPEHVDVLLRGVDMLSRIANGSNDPKVDWKQFDAEATPLVKEISAVLSGAPPTPHEATPALPTTPSPSPVVHEELVISVPAMLDASAAETVRRSFIAGLDAGVKRLRLNMSETLDLDAIGLALLAAISAHAEEASSRVVIEGVCPDLERVLAATGVLSLYPAGGH